MASFAVRCSTASLLEAGGSLAYLLAKMWQCRSWSLHCASEVKLELPPEVPVEEARLLLMVKLFETGRLSLGQAARLAGYSKHAEISCPARDAVAFSHVHA